MCSLLQGAVPSLSLGLFVELKWQKLKLSADIASISPLLVFGGTENFGGGAEQPRGLKSVLSCHGKLRFEGVAITLKRKGLLRPATNWHSSRIEEISLS